ncbi:hypothetical protein Tco_0402007, partial [Tanacetum coccineum]
MSEEVTISIFPGEDLPLSPATNLLSEMSLGNLHWGSLARDSFPSDNPQRR